MFFKKRDVLIAGGILAFVVVCSFLSPWLLPAIRPEAPPDQSIILDCEEVFVQIGSDPQTRGVMERCKMPGGETCLLSSSSRSYSLVYCYPEQPK